MPKSVFKKKHHSIAYHWFREAVADDTVRLEKDPKMSNLVDLFTKMLPRVVREKLSDWFNYWIWRIRLTIGFYVASAEVFTGGASFLGMWYASLDLSLLFGVLWIVELLFCVINDKKGPCEIRHVVPVWKTVVRIGCCRECLTTVVRLRATTIRLTIGIYLIRTCC